MKITTWNVNSVNARIEHLIKFIKKDQSDLYLIQELMIYMHGTLFTVAAGYTLLYDEHVRVDSFYRESSKKFKNVVNLIGTLTLLMPFIIVTFLMSYPYVIRSWKI